MLYLKKTSVLVGSIVFGIALTLLGISLVFSDFEWIGVALTPVWSLVLFGGAYLFPDAMTELGHPVAHVIGGVLNSIFIGLVSIAVFALVKRLKRRFN